MDSYEVIALVNSALYKSEIYDIIAVHYSSGSNICAACPMHKFDESNICWPCDSSCWKRGPQVMIIKGKKPLSLGEECTLLGHLITFRKIPCSIETQIDENFINKFKNIVSAINNIKEAHG